MGIANSNLAELNGDTQKSKSAKFNVRKKNVQVSKSANIVKTAKSAKIVKTAKSAKLLIKFAKCLNR